MAIRPLIEEIFVEDKITDEELFKDVVADPNMIKMSEPEEVPAADAEVKSEGSLVEETSDELATGAH
jgi:hypothetical protein